MAKRPGARAVWAAVAMAAAAGWAEAPLPGREPSKDARERALQQQIVRLRSEVSSLEARATGLLGQMERIAAKIRLREAELAEVNERLGETERAIGERRRALRRIGEEQERRRAWLTFRLRQMYERGPRGDLARWVAPGGGDALEGMRYAAWLSERDGEVLRGFREDAERVAGESRALEGEQARLVRERGEAEAGRAALEASRREQAALLDSIQGDRAKREQALGELESASRDLGRIVERIGEGTAAPAMDVRKFRGLLDWPAAGRVSAGFGSAIHPKFRTAVPHPGLDIEAPAGADIRAVFDGRVAFAGPLHGYGLTAIVDHGAGLVSVYTHASVLLVEAGQSLLRGEVLGKVGDSGSMRGPFLYFEIREAGRAVDPSGWLRPR